ncbi:hypothetical protein [Clostridium felsineum]|uniref:Uncharacterized protein n=1 Tax=Clostridium felsineum TaxID=36839 RepID=A0A1S8L8D1_9CLOT|nr:hypothetical protein [Clostridium felsineum]URZ05079.1 hypothetical protein CLROS_004030 [Clostridium felsineum]URZ10120.1 hypothetical protein CROST_008280 [Clostridium felsineum]
MRIVNIVQVDFKYRFSKDTPVITKTTFSNKVVTTIVEKPLIIKMWVNKSCSLFYDILVYKIEIHNVSGAKIGKLLLRDFLPEGINFVYNSLHINHKLYRCTNVEGLIFIGKIEEDEKIEISYKVVINEKCKLSIIKNKAEVTFECMYNIEKKPIRISLYSNVVETILEHNLFKEFVVKNKIDIPRCKGTIDSVVKIETNIKIVEAKVINTKCKNKRIKEECFNLEVEEVLFLGIIEYKIKYMNKHKLVYYNSEKGFSTTIEIPKGINYFRQIDAEILNESMDYFVLDKLNIVISNCLIMKIGD